MKIATLNIDWGGKAKSKNNYLKIEEALATFSFDILVITEGIDLNLPQFPYKYFSVLIPENITYEGLNYTKYLKGEKAYRTIVYSKYKCKFTHQVTNDKTSLALEFDTEFGSFVIYTTIVGTWFKKQPFALKELENCIQDCNELYKKNKNIIVVGDLNTSFFKNEKSFSIGEYTTERLESLFKKLNLYVVTKNIEENIDHIVLPVFLKKQIDKVITFVEKGSLSDHKGVYVELKDV